MRRAPVDNPTNVRFELDAKARLYRLASRYGVTASDLIRAAVNDKIPKWEKNGIVLPIRRTL